MPQGLPQGFHQHGGVLPRAEDALPYGQGEPQEFPLAQNVLQRTAGAALLYPLQESGLLLRGGFLLPVEGQARPVQPQKLFRQQGRVPWGGFHSRLLQPPAGVQIQLAAGHRIRSSPFSGITASMATMAAAIILSSGSFTVSRCIHSPGAVTRRDSQLS